MASIVAYAGPRHRKLHDRASGTRCAASRKSYREKGKSPLVQRGLSLLTRLEASARPAASPAWLKASASHSAAEGDKTGYFFLVGFLVAFFFAMVLFNFGLDLAVFVPGFLVAGIRSSYAFAAAGRA